MTDQITSDGKGSLPSFSDIELASYKSRVELSEYKREIENKLNEGLKETSRDLAEQFSKQVSATKIQTRWIIGTFITIIGLILSLIGIIITIWLHK